MNLKFSQFLQMNNEKGENKGAQFDEEKARHEKEHMKKIFLKFIDSALQG